MASRSWVLAVLLAMTVMGQSAWAEPVRVAPTLDGSKSCGKPQYPIESRRAGEQGTVVLRFLVGPDGLPIRSEIFSSSGFERLDKAAQDALNLCHFNVGTIDGKPATEPSWAQLRYTWKLETAAPGVTPTLSQGWEPKCSAQPAAADFAGQLAQVAAGTKIGGVVRFVVPPMSSPMLSACRGLYLRAQAEAVRKAGLFDRVDLDESGIAGVRPRPKSEDYTVWLDRTGLIASYRGGPRAAIGDGSGGLAYWTVHMVDVLPKLRELQNTNNHAITTVLLGLQPYFSYLGKEYLSTADLEEGVRADASAEGLAVAGVPAAGRSARLILVPEPALIAWAEMRTAQAQEAERHRTAIVQLAGSVAAYAQSAGWAGALHSSGMFKDVSIEEGLFTDPPLSGYDAVIWNEPADPFRWKVRDSSGAIHEIPPPDNAGAWIMALQAVLTKEKTK
jgi:TonB family protein